MIGAGLWAFATACYLTVGTMVAVIVLVVNNDSDDESTLAKGSAIVIIWPLAVCAAIVWGACLGCRVLWRSCAAWLGPATLRVRALTASVALRRKRAADMPWPRRPEIRVCVEHTDITGANRRVYADFETAVSKISRSTHEPIADVRRALMCTGRFTLGTDIWHVVKPTAEDLK